MKHLWNRIWNAEPVRVLGALAAAWSALVTFDQANAGFTIPVWIYAAATVLLAAVTPLVRGKVTPTD